MTCIKPASDANLQPLDNDLPWTFASRDNKERFVVKSSVAKLSKLFASMIENGEEGIFSIAKQQHDTDPTKVYVINDTRMFGYVYKYFKLWEDNPSASSYEIKKPIKTSFLEHVLQKKDITFIQEYIADCKATTKNEIIDCLGALLCQVSQFLDIECLSNKICAYIAVILWNLSPVDFAEAMNDQEFVKEQEAAVKEWCDNNPGKCAQFLQKNKDTIPTILKALENIELNAKIIDSEECEYRQKTLEVGVDDNEDVDDVDDDDIDDDDDED